MANYVGPSQNNYSGLDRGFNQRFQLDASISESKGEGVYVVYDTNDVLDTLNEIGQKGIASGDIRMISGGHCYENFTFQGASEGNENYAKYIIDLSNMQGIYEEVVDNIVYVVVEPGATNWLMQSALHSRYGATLPGGSCYSVCAGGHLAGGGYGLLSRLHGLTVDYLEGVEMIIPHHSVLNEFKLRPFSPDDPDSLNWASRGGGAGHFGVITKYYFQKDKLPRAPERALFVTIPVPWAQFMGDGGSDNFTAFMTAYYTACGETELIPQAFTLGKFTANTGEQGSSMAILIQVVYGESSGHDASVLGGANVAAIDKAEAQAAVDRFVAAMSDWAEVSVKTARSGQKFLLRGHPISGVVDPDIVYDLPWIEMTQLLNGSGENQKGKYKSSKMIENFTGDEALAMYEFLTDTNTQNMAPAAAEKAQTLIQIDSYGSQINSMDDGSGTKTAIAARSSVLKAQYQTYWKTTEASDPVNDDIEIITWFNQAYNDIHRRAQPSENSGFPLWGSKYQGCYFNYPDTQIGVNSGHALDPGETYAGEFLELYFGDAIANRLLGVKLTIDYENVFSFAQSIPLLWGRSDS